jgi:hypothetical protein
MEETIGCMALAALVAIIGIALMVAVPAFEGKVCAARWSPTATRWSLFAGCQVEVRPGVWVPEGNVRDIPLAR